MVGNNAVNWWDYLGWMPFEHYGHPDEAAMDAAKEIHPLSEEKEWATLILKCNGETPVTETVEGDCGAVEKTSLKVKDYYLYTELIEGEDNTVGIKEAIDNYKNWKDGGNKCEIFAYVRSQNPTPIPNNPEVRGDGSPGSDGTDLVWNIYRKINGQKNGFRRPIGLQEMQMGARVRMRLLLKVM
jgi:hypothetical protein